MYIYINIYIVNFLKNFILFLIKNIKKTQAVRFRCSFYLDQKKCQYKFHWR